MSADPLREAATQVVRQAEPDEDGDGLYMDFIVPSDAIEALRAALAPLASETTVADEPSPAMWFMAMVLHAEMVHGCEHTKEAREQADHLRLPPSSGSIDAERDALAAVAEAEFVMVPTKLLWTEWPLTAGQEDGYPFDDLVASIRAEGIREPLTIKRDWSVIDGAHRLRVARLEHIDTVPVRIWTGVEWLPAYDRTVAKP